MHKDKHKELINLRQHLQRIEKSGVQKHGVKSTQPTQSPKLLTPANDDKPPKPLQLPPLLARAQGLVAAQLPQLVPPLTSDILAEPVLHEVHAKTYGDPASIGFLLLALKAQSENTPSDAPILWATTRHQIHDGGCLFAPGLLAFNLDPNRFIMVTAKNDTELLWVLEEATRAKSFAAVVGHIQDLSFTQTRRLSLATQQGATPLFLHRPHHCQGASAAFSRWQIESQGSAKNPFDERAPGTRQLRAHLLRCRTGQTGSWSLEYETSTYPLLMVPAAANRKFAPHVASNTPRQPKGGHGFAS
ncbi:ImuA family protein [Maritalea porphyrae]|uniref:ImuA family protein n=3 Tax=Maritalea TaxID=623276 RepID=UPI0022AF4CB3|nr:hypothetical protein [Maritalea porphyrae]MCZ4272378.1 hypothetical protein [Maritalea porphyrae]